MRVSVVIPTYNSAAVIRPTLDSVLRQTLQPAEILVLDDGSRDSTVSILDSYQPRITVIQRQNRGVAAARNVLGSMASGDLIAFLDHDDLWHPAYLETQRNRFLQYPKAVAFFTGHIDFCGYGNHEWGVTQSELQQRAEVLEGSSFFESYNHAPGRWGSMSFLCIPKRVLSQIGGNPFCEAVSGADDFYLCNTFPLLGPVVYTLAPLVAYRIVKEAQSANQVKSFRLAVEAMRILAPRYAQAPGSDLRRLYHQAFAAKKRRYAKTLMGIGNIADARQQLREALRTSAHPASLLKTALLWGQTHLPSAFQPAWPSRDRVTVLTQCRPDAAPSKYE